MKVNDPKQLEYLRGLPLSYLLDPDVHHEGMDQDILTWLLVDRGMTKEAIDKERQRLKRYPWLRVYKTWALVRGVTLCNALIVALFNFLGLQELLQSDHEFKTLLLFFVAGAVLVGFFLGYKITIYLYHGSKDRFYYGFPCPVGIKLLATGEDLLKQKPVMYSAMACNALVGISLTLFPVILMSKFLPTLSS
jgi:hypothetical protein